jgi:hypothetical protein
VADKEILTMDSLIKTRNITMDWRCMYKKSG